MSTHLGPALVIIDDNEDDVFLLKCQLARAGVAQSLLIFTDSLEAIKYFGRVSHGSLGRPAAAFLDINMPRCDGFGVLETIRGSDELDAVSVIMLSSSDDTSVVFRERRQFSQLFLT